MLLAEATALYRTGAVAEADRAAQPIQRAGDIDAAARATILRGLIADERGDETGLTAAVDALNAEKTPALEADFAELAARLALRRSDSAHARQKAARAAELRQEALDYRGLARALAVEAAAAERAGDEAAADLFLRAGRSAAAQATRPARVCGSGARPTLPLAVRSGKPPPSRCVASIKLTSDRGFRDGGRLKSDYAPSGGRASFRFGRIPVIRRPGALCRINECRRLSLFP